MITLDELNKLHRSTTLEQAQNLIHLCWALNIVRAAYGLPMVVTSGFRSVEDQVRINPSAPHSKHLDGRAADIYDPDSALYNWLKLHEAVLTRAGLWCEERQGPWQHFQTVPPKSGHLWFYP